MPTPLAEVLGQYVQRAYYSAGQVAALSGVPKRSVVNWLTGRVKRPHQPDGLLNIAAALKLNPAETDTLLQAAAHPSLAELRRTLPPQRRTELLAFWNPTKPAPFQAIADLPYFVGRTEALTALKTRLVQGKTVSIVNLRGMGGVGKTALAAHLAYHLRSYFSDGVLWARLDTANPFNILADFAAAYGHDVSQHRTLASRASAVRSILAPKNALIVLDNAEHSEQIRPLLPPSTGKLGVLITTRHDLSVLDGLYQHHLRPFTAPSGESLALFRQILGADRVQAEAEALRTLADLLGHLPLALSIAAGRLQREATAAFLHNLQASESPLDDLTREDRSVRLAFERSYETLSAGEQQILLALAGFGGQDVALEALAAVAECQTEALASHLENLLAASLVQAGRPNRYQLHPLVQAFAREKWQNDHWPRRVVAYCVRFAQRHQRDYPALHLELDNILAALDTALSFEWPAQYIDGLSGLAHYLEVRGLYEMSHDLLEKGHQLALDLQDEPRQAVILARWGNLYNKKGNYAHSKALLEKALLLAEKTQVPSNTALVLIMLGGTCLALGENERTAYAWQTCNEIAAQIGDARLERVSASNLSMLYIYQGQYDLARKYAEMTLPQLRQQQESRSIIVCLNNLADIYKVCHSLPQALEFASEALSLAQHIQNKESEARAYLNVGSVLVELGQFSQAERHLQAGLQIAQALKHQGLTSLLLSNLGFLAVEQADYPLAQQYLAHSLRLAEKTGYQNHLALVLCNLGGLAVAQNQSQQAETHLLKAKQLAEANGFKLIHCEILNALGCLQAQQKNFAQAEDFYHRCIKLAQKSHILSELGHAYFGLAQVIQVSNAAQAESYAQQSLAHLERLGHYKRYHVAQWLKAVGR